MEKKIVQVQERTQQLIRQLLNVWESSVRATHDFLSEEEIIKIRESVSAFVYEAIQISKRFICLLTGTGCGIYQWCIDIVLIKSKGKDNNELPETDQSDKRI